MTEERSGPEHAPPRPDRSAEMEIVRTHLLGEAPRAMLLTREPSVGAEALVETVRTALGASFPGGVVTRAGLPPAAQLALLADAAGDCCLIVLVDLDRTQAAALAATVEQLWSSHPEARVLVTTPAAMLIPSRPGTWMRLHVTAAALRDLKLLWQEAEQLQAVIAALEAPEPPAALASRRARGRRATGDRRSDNFVRRIAGDIRTRLGELDELFERYRDQLEPAILGPDGRPLDLSGPAFAAIELQVERVSAELLRKVVADPRLLHELSPRRFEELMADLYAKQGFEVELTQPAKDGGVDLFLVRHEAFGRMLTVVECKRYAPDRPVGVHIVRQMHGVLANTGANAAVIATTSSFTSGAQRERQAFQFRLALQDYAQICTMLRMYA